MNKIFRILFVVGAISFISPQTVGANDGAEVFDISKGEVVRTIPNSNLLQYQVKILVSSVIGVAGSFRIEPSDGIAIKVRLAPPYKVQTKRITGTVTEVVLFVGRSQTYTPTMLVFTKENRFLAFHIEGNTLASFLKRNMLYSSEFYLGPTYKD